MVVLEDDGVRLRLLRYRDRTAWQAVRARNADWLRPWEASSPVPSRAVSFTEYVAESRRLARRGEALTFVIEVDDEIVGQLSVSPIVLGALRGASIGYWVSRHVAGRGIAPTAVAIAGDHCFTELGLHRLEINIRPENTASLRVVSKLGFRDEGLRRRYLHIDGDWRDHRTFALLAEEVPGGLRERWKRSRGRHAGRDPGSGPAPG
ncbi:GNAT family protein [Georgenia sp. H159]|uniref:GNAT family N-acetyltransferase n=1 Tax=Georgenia sp. H159 TaxID=3076115 RepID=UPI002D7A06EC|nr:GNAT family protein [Georgenia sp. H159]